MKPPQSNILTTTERTVAMLLAQARNVPQAPAAFHGRPLGARTETIESIELADKTLEPSSAWAGSARL